MVASGVRAIMKDYKGSTEFLLEISAGAGNVIGDTFQELEYIISNSSDKVGICLDTAHMFASGYDIKSKEGMDITLANLKKTVGLDKIRVIHANDSKVGLNERKDRHDHVGDGKIGEVGFLNMLKVFPKLDFILETKHDKVSMDITKLKEMRNKI
jgi:deoxyribonuclease-4